MGLFNRRKKDSAGAGTGTAQPVGAAQGGGESKYYQPYKNEGTSTAAQPVGAAQGAQPGNVVQGAATTDAPAGDVTAKVYQPYKNEGVGTNGGSVTQPNAGQSATAVGAGTGTAQPVGAAQGAQPGAFTMSERELETWKNGYNGSQGLDAFNVKPGDDKKEPIVAMPSLEETQKIHDFAQSHPWVLGTNDKYKETGDKSGIEIARDINTYRKMTGEDPLSYTELMGIIGDHNPYKSQKQETKEKRRAAWAERIEAIGDVINHFVNFGRAMGGNPIADVKNVHNSERWEKLRQADQAFRNQQFTNYITQVMQEQKRRDELGKEQRAYDNAVALKKMELLSPKAQLEVKKLAQSMEEGKWKALSAQYEAEKKKLEMEGYSEERAANVAWLNAKAKNAGKTKSSSGGKKDTEKDPNKDGLYDVDGHRFKTYDDAMEYARTKYPREDARTKIVVH